MARSFRHLILIAFVVIALPHGRAESNAAAGPLCAFTVFAPEPLAGLAYVAVGETKPVRVSCYPTARSPRYFARVGSSLRFFEASSGETLGEVTLAEGTGDELLVFVRKNPREPRGRPWRILVLDDGAKDAAPGCLRVINLSGFMLYGEINHRDVTLSDGDMRQFRVRTSAVIELRTPFRGRSFQAYSDTIPLPSAGRAVLLLLPPWRAGECLVQSRVLFDVPQSSSGVRPQ